MAAATLTFQYSVRDKTGKVVSGTLEADSQATVAAKLKQMGYAPISISKHKAGMKTEIKIPGFGGKVKLKDLAVMSRQFAVMINSGLSLLRALTILSEQTENKVLAGILAEVRNDIETGVSLSSAMAKHPKAFPPLMVNMTRAGEIGGFLDAVLLQIAENYEAEVKLRGKVKSAMTYPVVVFIMAILADDRHAAVHRPDLRGAVRRPGRHPAGADPGAHLHVGHAQDGLPGLSSWPSSPSRSSGRRSSTPTRSATSSTRSS